MPSIAAGGSCGTDIGEAQVDPAIVSSIPVGIEGQDVIATGKEACKKARPTKAGLNGLLPSPPKMNFPIPIATMQPKQVIHSGNDGGKVIP